MDREINYLQFVSNEWLSTVTLHHNGDIGTDAGIGSETNQIDIISNPLSHNLYSLVLNGTIDDDRHGVTGAYTARNHRHIPAHRYSKSPLSAAFVSTSNTPMYTQMPTSQPITLMERIGKSTKQHRLKQTSSQRPNVPLQNIAAIVDHLREDIDVLLGNEAINVTK